MKFLKELWNRFSLFIIKAIGSRKFYAWILATVLLVLGILSGELWLAATTIYTASIVAEKIGVRKEEGK
jgi:hypothetical protein